MLTLKGQLLNIFKSPDFTNSESGEIKHGKTKLQLLVEQVERNGEIKKELLDISLPDEKIANYKNAKAGDIVSVEVGTIANGKKVIFYGV